MTSRRVLQFSAALVVVVVGIELARAAEEPQACSLLTKDEFAQVLARPTYGEPDGEMTGVCGYDGGQVLLYSGPNSQSAWEGTLKAFGYENAERIPIEGVGESAYAFYTTPQNEYQDASAFVVFVIGEYTVAVSVDAENGQSGATVHEKAVTLAKLAAERLR